MSTIFDSRMLGGWEIDESMEQAALRETIEEVGVIGSVEIRLLLFRIGILPLFSDQPRQYRLLVSLFFFPILCVKPLCFVVHHHCLPRRHAAAPLPMSSRSPLSGAPMSSSSSSLAQPLGVVVWTILHRRHWSLPSRRATATLSSSSSLVLLFLLVRYVL
ncbi:hypothetical protein LR48_Vigan304s002000 [Vigna angularis]|uniref:Nudix hydrolase domain-containing protein n=1 Tax=Phaseolus angularis TaxID=3914 RepID=A0A0L9T7W9_PHAAN|nr:hypothetical protein LR48_Vigan304s002000 [Vigna angularis]